MVSRYAEKIMQIITASRYEEKGNTVNCNGILYGRKEQEDVKQII